MKKHLYEIKAHLKENKKTYLAGASGVALAVGTMLIMKGRHAEIPRVSDGSDVITVRPFSFLSKQENNIVNVIEREGRGHPGYIVRCVETGDVYHSQVEAAKAIGTYPSVLSGHLNGKLNDVYGMHYERLADSRGRNNA